ncbi:MAG: glutamate--cysteine ligase [Paludibacterium sp.]|uniref:YbdK family carboxylate-amine ligase n=1 Tax=Paludibacterium sp. TaxID=1917523 RepID=UPI0025F49E33|nr:YbdK family carboxylate-amine ligase [Paludibacterium sp.]MBV8049319.1 glutamate--cysteine ligase [Paludibacterium sp.]MBV8646742.1 glutamate--cysteine ligase [Paludibacterium sp.]
MLEFTNSPPLTLGIELELMIVNRHDYNLTRGSDDLLSLLDRRNHGFDIKPEITQGMIETATGIHDNLGEMYKELCAIRGLLNQCAEKLNLGLAGGGAHPFQRWGEQRIYPKERYRLVSELYGYLAKQFTVFGQHIHIGCPDGDSAVRLTHFLSRYIPHFIALSASSPFYQGADTLFQTSRLSSVNAFPLSGCMPLVQNWAAFNQYFGQMHALGIVASMKDFYWDIRPKPEFGTVEIRICDTPVSLGLAPLLAGYARMLAHHCLATGWDRIEPALYLPYTYNRFQACRFGLDGDIILSGDQGRISLLEDMLTTLDRLTDDARALGLEDCQRQLRERVVKRHSDSEWLRAHYAASGSLSDTVRRQSERWMYDA